MRTFRAKTLQPNTIPWKCWDNTEHTIIRDEVWGETLVPRPFYESLDKDGNGVGEPLYYEWQSMIDPSDTPLPNWITEITE